MPNFTRGPSIKSQSDIFMNPWRGCWTAYVYSEAKKLYSHHQYLVQLCYLLHTSILLVICRIPDVCQHFFFCKKHKKKTQKLSGIPLTHLYPPAPTHDTLEWYTHTECLHDTPTLHTRTSHPHSTTKRHNRTARHTCSPHSPALSISITDASEFDFSLGSRFDDYLVQCCCYCPMMWVTFFFTSAYM